MAPLKIVTFRETGQRRHQEAGNKDRRAHDRFQVHQKTGRRHTEKEIVVTLMAARNRA